MTNIFSTTGGMTHSTVVTGLVSNGNYNYYVRCQDSAGNTDTYDYPISFTVSSTATSVSSTFSGTATVLSDNGLWQTPVGSYGAMSENNGAYAVGTDAAMVRSPLVGPDEYSEITYSQDPGTSGWAGVMTRMQGATNGSGYLAFVYNETVYLYRVDDYGNGSLAWNYLEAVSANVGTAPRDLRLQSQGNTHTVILNGTVMITYTDPNNTYSSGQPGIAAATFSSIVTFSGGNL